MILESLKKIAITGTLVKSKSKFLKQLKMFEEFGEVCEVILALDNASGKKSLTVQDLTEELHDLFIIASDYALCDDWDVYTLRDVLSGVKPSEMTFDVCDVGHAIADCNADSVLAYVLALLWAYGQQLSLEIITKKCDKWAKTCVVAPTFEIA